MKRYALWLDLRPLLPVLLTGLSACATEMRTFQPPSDEIREQLSTAEWVMLSSEQTVALDEPKSGIGAGAAEMAGAGAEGGAAAAALPGLVLCKATVVGCIIGLPLAIVMAPVGAVAGGAIGAGVGASVAHSDEEVEAASTSLRAALADATLNEDLFGHMQTASSGLGVGHLKILEGTPADHIVDAEELGGVWPNGYVQIAASMAFESRGEWDPDVSIILSARARLVGPEDQANLYRRAWEYRSPWRDYFDMAEDDARLLRTMIDTGLRELAVAIVTDLFVETEPEVHEAGTVPIGQVWTVMAQAANRRTATREQAAITYESRSTADGIPIGESLPTVEPAVASVGPAAEDGDAALPSSGHFGAIAFGTTSTFQSGFCVNEPTPEAAASCALRDCGRDCEVHVAFGSGQCAAVAGWRGVAGEQSDDPQNSWRLGDYGVGSSPAAALGSAMGECGNENRNCAELVSPVCNLESMRVASDTIEARGPTGVREALSESRSLYSDLSALAGRHGAIAVSTTSTFRSGSCVNEPTLAAAESCALRECGRYCAVHVAFGAGQCAAVAGKRGTPGVRSDSPQNRWRLGDHGVGNSPAAALESAMNECRSDNRNCSQLVRPVCNG